MTFASCCVYSHITVSGFLYGKYGNYHSKNTTDN